MAVTYTRKPNQSIEDAPVTYILLSTDTKPTVALHPDVPTPTPGSQAYEHDTGIWKITHDGTTWVGLLGEGGPAKTIQTELQAITAVAADAQSTSSTLDLTGIKKAVVFIDHAKDHASASVGQGCEYVVQVSEKATGNDTWRALTSFTASITAPTVITLDNDEAAGQTVIECGATVPVVGDIIFFKNTTLANSEWANVVARVTTGGSESVTLESGLTNAQADNTHNTQGEHFVAVLDVSAFTRLRVVCNNTKGTTNRAIVWRVAAITEV